MKLLLTAIVTFLFSSVIGQTNNCAAVLKENQDLKTFAGLYSNHKKDTIENLEFTFFRAVGNIKKQSVTVEFLIKNIGQLNTKYYFDNTEITDELTNSKEITNRQIGTQSDIFALDLISLISKKYSCNIERVTPLTMKYVKNISFRFENHSDFKQYTGSITGDKIMWN